MNIQTRDRGNNRMFSHRMKLIHKSERILREIEKVAESIIGGHKSVRYVYDTLLLVNSERKQKEV